MHMSGARLLGAEYGRIIAFGGVICVAATAVALVLSAELVALGVSTTVVSLIGVAIVVATADRRWGRKLLEQDRKLSVALNHMHQGLCMFDSQARLVVCNERYLQMYGLSPEVVKPGCTLHDLLLHRKAAGVFNRDPDAYCADLRQQIASHKTSKRMIELRDGRVIELVNQPIAGGGWVATHDDITEQRRREKELAGTRHFLDLVIDNVPAAIVVKDAREFKYVLINRQGEALYGLPRERMIGKTTHELFPKAAEEFIAARDRQLVETKRPQVFSEYHFDTPHRGRIVTTSRRLPILDDRGEPQYLLAVIQDVTEQKQAEAKIAYLAHHDALTDLPNRVGFGEFFAVALDRAGASGGHVAVLCIDIDRFKEINDVFGHAMGDTLLGAVTRRLRTVAGDAFFARLDGDEFGLIISDNQLPTSAAKLADRLIAAIAEEFVIEGRRLQINLSIGVALYPGDGTCPAALLANAEAALYRAKAGGCGSIRFFEAEMDERLRERRALAHDLRSALARGEFTLHYQPQAQIAGKIVGFEALVRWQHPVHGIIGPKVFIPLAEESGLILELGEWILREACREAASWPKPLRVAVNVSPVQFRHGDLVRIVQSALLDTKLAPARLDLEITESVLVDDAARAVSMLRRLKGLGVQIVMDDFGTGYSSLQNLQSFSFDKLKIDRSFISNLETNKQSATIVRAVIGLGRGLDLPIVAEGVETQAQLAFLAAEACDEVQGFLVGRPQPIDAYADAVGRRPPRRRSAVN